MNEVVLDSYGFPRWRDEVRAKWAPLVFSPIPGSYERLVVACAVVGPGSHHVQVGNQLSRLGCLYGAEAEIISSAVYHLVNSLAEDIKQRGIEALLEPRLALEGAELGRVREAAGQSVESIAHDWLATLSSFHIAPKKDADILLRAAHSLSDAKSRVDSLPIMVFDSLSKKHLELSAYFSEDIRNGRVRRRRNSAFEVTIDFSGKKLVANFATLGAGGVSASAGNIKERLWDLKVDRERDKSKKVRAHELIIKLPDDDHPELTDRKRQNFSAVLSSLEAQADEAEMRLRSFTSVRSISEHIEKREAA
ncbi:hypothetical protein [Paracoccus salsus]|uniref:hypothetical protein n=1 Tax=Paracoccus salsus TaxID=2911061 RepID=UPI001F287FE5|nr:hypothetical protein [Paracoccus salsus]